MSKLDEAEKRLQRAVAALEQAARARSGNAAAAAAPSEAAQAELAAARSKAEELQALNASVAEQLDGAILRVKNILEN